MGRRGFPPRRCGQPVQGKCQKPRDYEIDGNEQPTHDAANWLKAIPNTSQFDERFYKTALSINRVLPTKTASAICVPRVTLGA
jgi:hypothetical protein